MAIKGMSLIDFYTQESPFATEFRRLLHRLKKTQETEDLKTLMITSSPTKNSSSPLDRRIGIRSVPESVTHEVESQKSSPADVTEGE